MTRGWSMAHDARSVASGSPGRQGVLGGSGGGEPPSRGHSQPAASAKGGRRQPPPGKVHPTHFKRGEARGERDGNCFHGFLWQHSEKAFSEAGAPLDGTGNRGFIHETYRMPLQSFKNSKCKTSVIKSLKIAYISGLTKKEKNLEIWTRRYLLVSK